MKKSQKIAYLGVFCALAFAFSYIEFLFPFQIPGIPGVKLGLANIVVMAALYLFSPADAAFVSAVRIVLAWLIFGNFAGFIYSLCGGALSLVLMTLVKKTDFFGEVGVSVVGGAAHNIGQICAAVFFVGGAALSYLPILVISGVVTGAINGAVLKLILSRLKRKNKNENFALKSKK